MTARGTRAAPKNAETSCECPTVHEKPARGLSVIGDGATSFRRPNTDSIFGFNVGVVVNRVASTRTPYWNWRSGVRRYESPIATAPSICPVDRSSAVSVREKEAGTPASRSASELKVKVPSRFAAWFCVLPRYPSSVLSLMRCLLALSNHESVFWKLAFVDRELELSDWLPPNERFCTLLAPSASNELT